MDSVQLLGPWTDRHVTHYICQLRMLQVALCFALHFGFQPKAVALNVLFQNMKLVSETVF